MSNPDDYFLATQQAADDALFVADRRDGITVTPLIDGIDTFRAMEQAIAGARTTVHMAAWILNPDVPLQAAPKVSATLAARDFKKPVKTWGDLLATVAGLGAKVRILLTDYDPIIQAELHRMTWSSYQRLQASARARGGGNMEILPSLHLHEATSVRLTLAQVVLITKLRDKLNEAVTKFGLRVALSQVALMPRLETFLRFDMPTRMFVAHDPPEGIRVVSHHQKICIVDRTTGFCGGLDVQTGRLDDKGRHKKGWHDTHCRVDGQLAADLDRNFIGRWNAELTDFHEFIAESSVPIAKNADRVSPIAMPTAAVGAGTGTARGQLLRTISVKQSDAELPLLRRDDVLKAYQKAISLAEQFVYIENQYVRDERLADWLIARAAAKPALVVILVLPVAPEEIVNPPSDTDEGTKLGLFLQHTVVTKLIAGLGARFGVYSLVQQETAAGKLKNHPTNFLGSPQVYVHSKTMIIDDSWATIGSANTNPRSFEVDTEANIHWVDPVSVKKLRIDLWRDLLGVQPNIDGWAPNEFLMRWNALAASNKTAAPAQRKGLVVPHDPENLKDAQVDSTRIRHQFAELGDVPADNDALA